MSSSIGSIGGLGNNNYLFQMNARPMQQRQDDLFSKIDSDSSSGIDKTEFSAFAKKLSQDSGNSIDVDDVFSTYDTDGDGSLSTEELKSFMKDNAPSPPPPGQMQQAASAYGTDQSSDQMSTLLDLLKNISDLVGSSANGNGSSISTYLSKLMENISNGADSSVLNVTA